MRRLHLLSIGLSVGPGYAAQWSAIARQCFTCGVVVCALVFLAAVFGCGSDSDDGQAPCVKLPTAPSSPSPEDGATDASIGADLSWSGGDSQCGLSVTYDVYLGENPTPGSSELVCSDCTVKSYDPGTLSYDTHYYWQVVAKDANGATSSPVCEFTTEAEPCVDMPTVPSGPSPSDGATSISINSDLLWSGGDSQCGLPATYDVYFGENPTPSSSELVCSGCSGKSYDPGTVSYSTHYYWQVVAKDANGENASDVWNFTTETEPCTDPPTAPSGPSPSHSDTDVSIDADLSWGGGDSQCGLSMTYDVYFGENPTPGAGELVCSDCTVKSYDPGTLAWTKQYYWQIVAKDANGETSSPVWSFATEDAPCTDPPSAPANPSPADGATDVSISTTLFWDYGDSRCFPTVVYDIYFGTDPTPDSGELVCADCGQRGYDPGMLSYSTQYFWQVAAKDANGETPSPLWEFTTEEEPCTQPPTAPSNPTPSPGATEVSLDADLSWVGGDSQCGLSVTYDVYFGENPTPGSSELVCSDCTVKSYDPGMLSHSRQYHWKVVAKDANGETSSPVWSFTVEGPPCTDMPTVPSGPSPSDGATSISINSDLLWSGGDSQCGLPVTYDVYFGTNPIIGSSELVCSGCSGKGYDPGTLTYSAHYYWQVVAKDANGENASDVWSFTTEAEPCTDLPTAPSDPTPSDGLTDVSIDADLSWGGGDSQCGLPVTYDVYLGDSPTPGAGDLVCSDCTGKSYDPGTLAWTYQYYWKVVAKDANGETFSPVWSFTTEDAPCTDPPSAPANPSPSDGATGLSISTTLFWDYGDSRCFPTVAYDIYFGTDPTPDSGELVCADCGQRGYDPGMLSYDTHYYWQVVAKDPNGETSSPVWEFTTETPYVVISELDCDTPSIAAGDTVRLECMASGTETLHYHWSVSKGGSIYEETIIDQANPSDAFDRGRWIKWRPHISGTWNITVRVYFSRADHDYCSIFTFCDQVWDGAAYHYFWHSEKALFWERVIVYKEVSE